MFVLGIGEDVDASELHEIASSPNNVFRVDSFEDLDDRVPTIRRGICKLGKIIPQLSFSLSRDGYLRKRLEGLTESLP